MDDEDEPVVPEFGAFQSPLFDVADDEAATGAEASGTPDVPEAAAAAAAAASGRRRGGGETIF